MSDWLEVKAREERDRRLHGKEPNVRTWVQIAGDFVGWLAVWAIRWALGLALLAILAGLCLWGLVVIGNDRYILDCPGVVETREGVSIRKDSLHLDVTEFGGVTLLWADSDGTAMTATTSGLFQFLSIERTRNLLSLASSDKQLGYYMPLTRVVKLRLNDEEWFRGQCTERDHR